MKLCATDGMTDWLGDRDGIDDDWLLGDPLGATDGIEEGSPASKIGLVVGEDVVFGSDFDGAGDGIGGGPGSDGSGDGAGSLGE